MMCKLIFRRIIVFICVGNVMKTILFSKSAYKNDDVEFDYSETARLTIKAYDGGQYDHYGFSVAINNHIAAIGAYENNNAGAAYIYALDHPVWMQDKPNWILINKVLSNDLKEDDHFGYSLTINEKTIYIGAYRSDKDGEGYGAAYVFNLNSDGNYVQTHKLLSFTPVPHEYFGYAMTSNGIFTLITAYGNSDKGSNGGVVYVFMLENGSHYYGNNARLYPSDATHRHLFGCSVSISSDYVAIIGALGDSSEGYSSGAAYLFQYRSDFNVWEQIDKLIGSSTNEYDYFGYSVTIYENIAVVGAYLADGLVSSSGVVYVYRKTTDSTELTSWTEDTILYPEDGSQNAFFGHSVFVEKNAIIIGSPGDGSIASHSGSAYVYQLTSLTNSNMNQWTLEYMIQSPKGNTDGFGVAVAISGSIGLIGAESGDGVQPETGVVYMYTPDNEYSKDDDWSRRNDGKDSTSTNVGFFSRYFLNHTLVGLLIGLVLVLLVILVVAILFYRTRVSSLSLHGLGIPTSNPLTFKAKGLPGDSGHGLLSRELPVTALDVSMSTVPPRPQEMYLDGSGHSQGNMSALSWSRSEQEQSTRSKLGQQSAHIYSGRHYS